MPFIADSFFQKNPEADPETFPSGPWIPWGNAPKDTAVLVWLGDPYNYADVLEWNHRLECWAWREAMAIPGDDVPTHWMPLPGMPG